MATNDQPRWLTRRSVLTAGLGVVVGGGLGMVGGLELANGDQAKHPPAGPSAGVPPVNSTLVQETTVFNYHAENLKAGTSRDKVPTNWGSSRVLSGYLGELASTRENRLLTVYVSSTLNTINILAYRLGDYAGLGQRLVWRSRSIVVHSQPGPVTDRHTKMVTAPWGVTTTIDTSTWPEGFYYLVLSDGRGNDHVIPLVVESETLAGKAVLVLNDCTMQAYNRWGGYSLYRGPHAGSGERAHKVSFDRPYQNFVELELRNSPLVRAAEAIPDPWLKLGYTTEARIAENPELIAGAASVMFGGHSEYWSTPMRRSVEAARDSGTNVIFFGANNVYWRTRMEPSALGQGRVMVCYRLPELDPMSKIHPELSTTMWRAGPHPEPESTLTGSVYGDLKAAGMFTVSDPGFFAFAGTAAKKGDTFPGLVGGETDFVHPKDYPIHMETPQGLKIFAHSPAAGSHHSNGWADSTFYTAKSGAGVIDMGSLNWLQATADPGVPHRSRSMAIRVTQNIIRESGRGRLGDRARSAGASKA